MAFKSLLFVCAQALLAQCVFGQLGYNTLLPAASLAAGGNSAVENNIVVNSGSNNLNSLGFATNSLGFAANGAGVVANGAGLAANGVGLAANGVGLNANGVGLTTNGVGLAGNGVGLASLGAANAGAILNNASPNYLNVASISGGGVLPVTSYSSIVPGGLTVLSDNVIEGTLLVNGELPFLSAVAFEGGLATAGSGAASCGCGDGNIGIVSENVANGLGFGGLAGVNNLGGLRGLGRGGLVY